jgi:hypothetical protein
MKTAIKYSITLAMVLFVITGCASRKPKMTISRGPAQAVVQVIPPQGRSQPRVAPVNDHALPVYSNPIIEEVEMAPHINDEGNMVFPGKMLVIRTPGHWNLEAAKKNNQYYVPADNMPPQLAPPSKSYYDYIQSKKNGAVPTKQLDVSAVRVTGFTQREEEDQAKATLQQGETLAFDPYLGWVAINSSALQSGNPSDSLTKGQTPDEAQMQAALNAMMKALGGAMTGALNNQAGQPAQAAPMPQPSPEQPGNDAQAGSREQEVKKIIDDAFKESQKKTQAQTPPPPAQKTTP